ncbi:sulfatase-like hydrolase/transferase [Lentisphaerota bacterium WC36G]
MKNKLLLLTTAFSAFAIFQPSTQARSKVNERGSKSQPNVIYILLDDAGYADFSFLGQKKFSTPNIDKMAKEGMTFLNHYAGSTVCAPSRCALMTGKHMGRADIRANTLSSETGIKSSVCIAEKAKEAGYVTGA